ncbi:MAG TPA: PadR family transcriptional regulator [Coriobacteriia bacterium]|nr:PadR family transcriptional regulator [Coriobacteriia bacterium]
MGGGSGTRESQFRKGALELAILALLERGELYGVEIVDRLASVPGLAASSGTVYPLLSRLKNSELVLTAWRESPSGPPRKYYRLSAAGRDDLMTMSSSWRSMVKALDGLLEEESR